MACCSAPRAEFRIVTSLLVVCAEARPTRARRSWPASRATALAESVNLPKPDRKLRRAGVMGSPCGVVMGIEVLLGVTNDRASFAPGTRGRADWTHGNVA